jgi:hypothetical protein
MTVGELEQPTFGLYALYFEGLDSDLVALWTLDLPMTVRVRGRIVAATDFMGNALRLRGADLPVDGYARYLRVPHGGKLVLAGPDLGVNYASLDQGAQARASSATEGHSAEQAIDGIWAPRDPVPPGQPDWIGTYWQDAQPGASPAEPDWLEVTFPVERTINHAVLVTPLPAVSAVPRDFAIQVPDGRGGWRTVARMRGAVGWVHSLPFAPVRTRQARLLVTALNDGWHLDGRWMLMVRDDFTRYTSLQTMVLEVMLFGPEPKGKPQPRARRAAACGKRCLGGGIRPAAGEYSC